MSANTTELQSAPTPTQPPGNQAAQPAPISFARLAGWTILFQLAWNLQKTRAVLAEGALPDPDDFLRLHQIRNWMAGQSWFDVSVARMNPPAGGDMHWSRLVDAPIALLIATFDLFTDTATAERLASIVWPTLLLVATVLAVVAICDRLVPGANRLLALFFAVLCAPAMAEYAAGRIDHHNVQMLVFVLILLGIAWRDRVWAYPLIGAGIAVSAAVGVDTALLLAFVLAFLGVEWARGAHGPDNDGRGLLRVAASMGATAFVLFFALVPPGHWFTPWPDAYSIFFLLALLFVSIGFTLLALLSPFLRAASPAGVAGRLVAGAAVGGAALALLLALFPENAAGAFSGISPELDRRWLATIIEAQSLPSLLAQAPEHWVSTVAYGLVLIAAGAFVLRHGGASNGESSSANSGMIAMYAIMLLSFLATIFQYRLLRVGIFASIPVCVAAATLSWEKLSERFANARGLAAAAQIAFVLALLSPTWLVAGQFMSSQLVASPSSMQPAGVATAPPGPHETEGSPPDAADSAADWRSQPIYPICNRQSQYERLASLPPGKTLNDLNSGPAILIFTSHAITASNYHRNGAAILQTLDFFETTLAQAEDIARRSGARYVVYCDPGKPGVAEGESLVRHIERNRPPAWLTLVSPPGERLRVYEIDFGR